MSRGHRVVDPDKSSKEFAGCSALGLMTKAPRAGNVKTRLVPPLTNEEAAQLNRCFLQDTGAEISACCSDLHSGRCRIGLCRYFAGRLRFAATARRKFRRTPLFCS